MVVEGLNGDVQRLENLCKYDFLGEIWTQRNSQKRIYQTRGVTLRVAERLEQPSEKT